MSVLDSSNNMTIVSFLLILGHPKPNVMNCAQCASFVPCRFECLSPVDISSITKHKRRELFAKGTIIFDEGEMLKGIYCIDSGVIKLSKLSANGKDQIIKLVVAGDFLGCRSVFTKERSTLKAVALSEVSSCYIPKEIFLSAVAHSTNFSQALLRRFSEELIEADNSIVSLGQKSVSQRIASVLLYLKKQIGLNSEGYIAVQLSRSDYANIIGAATESVIRVLADFHRAGLISMQGKNIKIKNVAGLKAKASSVIQ